MEATNHEIAKQLLSLGVPPQHMGYAYLVSAIEMALEDQMLLHSITTCIYPEVARKFFTTEHSVERCIRTSITAAWQDGDREVQAELFGKYRKERPSNANFIAVLTTYLLYKTA